MEKAIQFFESVDLIGRATEGHDNSNISKTENSGYTLVRAEKRVR